MAITSEEIYDVNSTEEGGVVVELTQRHRLAGCTGATAADRSAEVFAASVLPAPGSVLNINTFSRLVLRARRFVSGPGQSGDSALVDCIYRRVDAVGGTTPALLRGRTALKQVTTSFDRNGALVEVEHTWPSDDIGIYPDGTPRAGYTETQSGVFTRFVPMAELYGELLYVGDNPGTWQAQYTGRVNSSSWQGGSPRTWLCFGGDIIPIEETISPRQWIVGFSFQYDDLTWDDGTTVTFIDPNTGRPPPGIVENQGWKMLQDYEEANFNDLF